MHRWWRLAMLTALLAAASGPARGHGDARTFYVSPTGDDSGAGTRARPFRTLLRAREAVRSVKWQQRTGEAGDIVVVLRGGTYHLAEPLVLDEEDSGNFGHSIVWRAEPGETPILVAGPRISGWQRWKHGIWRAHVPSLQDGTVRISQLLEDGVPGAVARTPNEGWFRWESADDWTFRYRPADVDPGAWDIRQLQVHILETGTYFSTFIPVDAIDAATRTVRLRYRSFYHYMMKPGKCYYFQNALALLDTPGEFFADRATGWLYYRPRCADPRRAHIEAITLDRVLVFQSTSARSHLHNVVVDGLTIMGSGVPDFTGSYFAAAGDNGHTADKDDTDRMTAPESRRWAQVWMRDVDRIAIRNCRLLSAGVNAVSVLGASGENTIAGCEISEPGWNGVEVFGDLAWYRRADVVGPITVSRANSVHNNYIHHVGRLSITGCGVAMSNTSDNVVSNNLITDTPKSGVLMFSQWDVPRELCPMTGNVIRDNELARCVTSSTDGGAFYIGATTENTTFENNRITDVWSWLSVTWPQPEDRPMDWCSIDFDPGMTFGTRVRNNVCFGENAPVVEWGRPEDESLFENNAFHIPDRYPDETPDQALERFFLEGRYPEWRTQATPWVWEKVFGSAQAFDEARVRRDWGLTADYHYPYPHEMRRPVALPLACGFEGTLSPCFLYAYSGGARHEYLVAAGGRRGSGALRLDKDTVVVRYRHPTPIQHEASVWIRDDPTRRHARCLFVARGVRALPAGVGVDGNVSHYRYAVWSEGKLQPTSVRRTAGWHQLSVRVKESGQGVELLIDGNVVGLAPNLTRFNVLDMGDDTVGSDSRGLLLDDLLVR